MQVAVFAQRPVKDASLQTEGSVSLRQAIGPFGFAAFLSEILTHHDSIVHVQRPNTYSSAFIGAAHLLHMPVVATVHRAEVLPWHPLPWRSIRGFVLKMLDRTICVSESTRLLAIRAGCPASKAIVIYNTIDEQRFRPRPKEEARRLLGLPPEGILLLYLGSLRREKGCATLVRAFARLDKSITLLLVGDGVLRQELSDLAAGLGVSERTQFTGSIPHDSEKLPLFYNAADIYVLPSITEGHSMALLEALASGTPVVASRVGGNVETVVDGENGFLVDPNNEEELRSVLASLVSSPGILRRFSEVARQSYLQRFGSETQLAKTLVIYETLIATRDLG